MKETVQPAEEVNYRERIEELEKENAHLKKLLLQSMKTIMSFQVVQIKGMQCIV